jgi:hypothetical protein
VKKNIVNGKSGHEKSGDALVVGDLKCINLESRDEQILIGHIIFDDQGNAIDWILEYANPAALKEMRRSSFRGYH